MHITSRSAISPLGAFRAQAAAMAEARADATRPITVRHAEPADSEALHGIFTDPGVIHWLIEVPYVPLAHTRKQVAEFCDGRYVLVACRRDEIVGALALANYASPRLRHVGRVGPVAVAKACHGMGIGSALMRAAIDLADNWLNLRRLELMVIAGNEPAIRLYEKFGFDAEGTHRAFGFQAGRYVDVLSMARVRRDRPAAE